MNQDFENYLSNESDQGINSVSSCSDSDSSSDFEEKKNLKADIKKKNKESSGGLSSIKHDISLICDLLSELHGEISSLKETVKQMKAKNTSPDISFEKINEAVEIKVDSANKKIKEDIEKIKKVILKKNTSSFFYKNKEGEIIFQ